MNQDPGQFNHPVLNKKEKKTHCQDVPPRMPLEQEGGRPPQGDFPLSQARTKYIIHIPHEKAKSEQTSTRAEKIGNHRPLLGGNPLGGGGKLKDVGYAEGGGDNE